MLFQIYPVHRCLAVEAWEIVCEFFIYLLTVDIIKTPSFKAKSRLPYNIMDAYVDKNYHGRAF